MYFDIYYTIVVYINSCYGYSRLSISLAQCLFVFLVGILFYFSNCKRSNQCEIVNWRISRICK